VPANSEVENDDARPLRSIAVYCGSSPGADPAFSEVAASFGRFSPPAKIKLVYGGGHVGLMGVLADAALGDGGEVHGVITRALEEKDRTSGTYRSSCGGDDARAQRP